MNPSIRAGLADWAVQMQFWGEARGVEIDPTDLQKVRTGELTAVKAIEIMRTIGMTFDPSVLKKDSDNRRVLELDTQNLTVIVYQQGPQGVPRIDMPCNRPSDSAEMREFARMLFLAADAYDHLKSEAADLPA